MKRYCGLFEQVRHGVIYPTILGIGTGCTLVTMVGVKKGVWKGVFKRMADAQNLEYLMVDGSIVRVHQHGAAKKNEQANEAEGQSRSGLSTKIHAAVDALGNPVRFILTQGQSSEYGQAESLIEGFEADFILGDKGLRLQRVCRENQV